MQVAVGIDCFHFILIADPEAEFRGISRGQFLALVALLLVQSDKFDVMTAQMMVKMGRGEDALRAMVEQKLKQKH